MKVPKHLICLCLLTIAFFSFSQNISYSSSSSSFSGKVLTGRRSMREMRMSTPNQNEQPKFKVIDEETKQPKVLEDSMSLKYSGSSDDSDELAYHIDYHGVTTHPTPTPKHPRP